MKKIYFILITCYLIIISSSVFSQNKVGNYVWEDINANGIQDEPVSSGLNNVRVELYVPNASLPDPTNDVLTSFVITSYDSLGNPGFFEFSGLSDSDYYLVFRNPGGDFLVSPKSNPSSSNLLDSDGTNGLIGLEKVGITSIFQVVNSTIEYHLDQGFHHPCYTPITAIANSNSPVCYNSTLILSGSSAGGNTYSWSGPNGFTSNLQNPSLSNVNLTNGGIYTLTVTDGTACSATASTSVTISPQVETPIFGIGSSSVRCQPGGTVIFSASASNSTGITYSMDIPSLNAGNSINASTGEVTFIASWSGISIITAEATGCNGPTSDTHTVTIYPPVASPIFSLGTNSTRCQGDATLNYVATASNSTSIAYNLDATSLSAGNSINSTTGAVTFIASYAGTATITATAQGCEGPTSSTHTVTITPSVETPIFSLGSSSTRCQGAGNITYTATATNSTSISYALNAASLTAGNTINSFTGEVSYVAGWSGSSIITATAAGCNGPKTANHTVIINPTVGAPVFNAGIISTRCQGAATFTYSATSSNSTGLSYALDATSLTAGNTINPSTGAVTFIAEYSGTSVITATSTGCNGPRTGTHTVTITPTVGTPVFTLGATSTRCQGAATLTYSASATNSTAITYSINSLSSLAGNTINSSTGAVTFVSTWTGTTTITASAAGCNGPKSSSHTVTITPSVTTPIFALGSSSTRCQGAGSTTYSATTSNSTGLTFALDATSTLAGNTINSNTGEVSFVSNWSGTSTITATATGCNGPKNATHKVTTTARVGTPVFALGSSSIRCQALASITYSANASNSSSITYSLDATSLQAGNTINASNGRVNYIYGWVGDAIITATVTGCNSSASASHVASSTASVETPIFNLGSSSIRCQGSETLSYSATAANSTSIVYSLNAASLSGGNTINSSTGAVTFTSGWTGTSTITATAYGCNGPKTAVHTVTITPTVGSPIFGLGLNSNRCQSAQNTVYSATATNNTGITYTLDLNSINEGNTINSSTGEVSFANTWFGVSQITATATGCNGPKSTVHTVTTAQPLQTPIFALGNSSVRCQNAGSVDYSATALHSTSVTYSLDATSLGAGNTINTSTGRVKFNNGWSGNSTVTATAYGCFGPLTATHTITTTPTVGNPIFARGNTSNRCIGAESILYTATASNNTGISYTLDNTSLSGGNTINSSTGEVTFDPAWFGTSTITVNVTGCNGPKSATHTVTTAQAVQTPVFALGQNSVRCQAAGTTSYTATTANSTGRVYSLDATSLSGGNSINSSTGAVTFSASWTGISIVTVTASGCYGPTQQTHTITTTPSVTNPIFSIGTTSIRCQGAGTVQYTATSTNETSLSYSLDGLSLAGGNTIDANTGIVTYSVGWSGTTRITAVATGCSGPKSTIHTVTVTPTVGFPVFPTGGSSVRCQGAYTTSYSATSTNSTSITYTLDGTSLTFGNTINTSTGAITFLAGWTGVSTITATANGCNGPRLSSHTISTTNISAANDIAAGQQGSPVIIEVLNNDSGDTDPTSINIINQPSNGFIQIGTNGEITYLPNGNFYGTDQFTYSVCSNRSSVCCSEATVNIQIEESLNDPCSEATKSKTYYLPFPESTNYLRKALWSAGNGSFLSDSVRTVISIKIPYPGNIMTFDHWEDGYESDISIPTQISTEVWGDGILNNGSAPGYPTDIIPAGGYILIDAHFKYNPRNSLDFHFDGKDKILSSSDIAISKISGDAGMSTGSNNFDIQNIKSNVFDLSRFGKFFVIPFGEDNTLGSTAAFKYTGIFARASENNTIINLDYDADGNVDISSPTLNEGDVWFYDGTSSTPGTATDINNANDIKSGAIITSAHNFGVDVVFGGIDNYGTRNIALLPGNFYGDVYYSPAHTTLSTAPVYAFFTNNLATSITIDWSSGTGASGSFAIAGKSYSYLNLNQSAAYKFASRNGEAFTAVAVFDADADGKSFDWSFNMIPESRLSTFASVAWAPGSSNGSGNFNPVWVTAPTATTLYIKYDGNLASPTATTSPCGMPYDIAVPITALQSYKILDPDNDQTGLAVFTCDGTKIAAIWGQDPNGAPAGTPGMDVGYVMEPRCLQQLIIANDDISDTEPSMPVIIDVQTNDYGFLCTPNPNSITTLGLLQPSNGIVTINSDGIITYTPNNGFQGTDEFEYRLCSVEYPGICDVALVKIRISTCIANSNENLFRGKVFVESLPDDGTFNGEAPAVGIKVDLYIDLNCNGVVDIGEGITESTVSDISGNYTFSTKDGNNARDDFDPAPSYSGNDGGLLWNNNWTESGDDGVINTGDIRIMADASGYSNAIRLSGPVNGINRALTFNNTQSAVLKFSYRRQGLDRQGEGVNVLINGSTVFTLNDGLAVGTDLNYTDVHLPITAYDPNGVNTLQFITNGSTSTDDYFWIDNVELSFYKNPPVCYVAKVNTSNTNGAYIPATLNAQTASFVVLGVCDKENFLGVLPKLIVSDDNAVTSLDENVIINVLQNDVIGKPDTTKVSFVGVTVLPSNGIVRVNTNGTINYTPNQGFTGADQFEYRVYSSEDPQICDVALVNVTVSCASSPLINEISGSVYVDNNNNGVFSLGEIGLENSSVNLIFDLNNNGIIDSGEPTIDSKLTDNSGYYNFIINPVTNSFNYLDQFNASITANQSNGTTNWTTSWTKIGDIGTFGQNNIQIISSNGLRIQSDANVVSGAYRSLNITGAVSASLSLDYDEQNLDLQVNDYVDLQIASSTTPTSWTLLKRFTGADGNQIGSLNFDISSYISPTTTIRFVSSGSSLMVPGDLVYFDNIRINYSMPVASRYIVQLNQPIPPGYTLTNPSPSPSGYYTASFTGAGQGTCGNNFGLAVTDLEVLKTVNKANPFVGDTVIFNVKATNFGPSNATNVFVTDILPTGYELVGVSLTKGTWVGASWNLGNMANGDSENLNITAKVIAPGGYLNTASIFGDQPEQNLSNNQSSAAPLPVPIIDLSLISQISKIRPNVGEIVTFTINLSNGDLSPATNVEIKTIVPNGFNNIVNITNGGTLSGNTITWNLGNVLNNSIQTFSYKARVAPPLVGTNYTTVAQVKAATEQDIDSTPNNGISTEDDQSSTTAIPLVADLRLTNQISSVLPTVGDVVTFTVTLNNDGPDSATAVAIANVLANGFGTITNISDGGVLVGNTITWNLASIANGTSRTFTYQATVLSPGSGITFANTAQVSASNEFDPDSSPNNNISSEDDQATVTATLQGADLSLTKQISNATPNVGDVVTFTITLHNSGPDQAANVGIEDIIPNGYRNITSISNSGSLVGNTINWTGITIANGANLIVTYQAIVNPAISGTNYKNVAQIVASDQFDPNSTPNNDIATENDQAEVTSVPRVANLSLFKQVNNLRPLVGEVLTFTIDLRNIGPDAATNIVIRDTIQNGYANITNISNSGILFGNILTWNIPSLINGGNLTLSYEVTVQSPLPGTNFTNIAQIIDADEFDPNSIPNNDNTLEDDQSQVTTLPQISNLSITKQISNLYPQNGDIVTFTVTVNNAGSNDGTNISVKDIIPNGYSNVSNISGAGILTGSEINWNIDTLENGADTVFTYQVRVEQSGIGISHKNIVEIVGADQFDPNSVPNNHINTEDDQAEITAVPQQADLSLIKQVNNLNPNPGDVVTFSITLSNAGPNLATNILVQDIIPNGYSNISFVSHSGTFVGNNLEWTVLSLPNGSSVVLTYQATVESPITGVNFTNVAQIISVDQFDPNSTPGNNINGENDQSEVTITPNTANLSLVKTINNTTPNVGDTVSFTITLQNNGPNAATNVSIEDIIPNGYSGITNISNSGTLVGSIINWNNLSLANGSNLILSYQAIVNAPILGRSFANIAQVTNSDQFDPNSSPSNDNPAEDDQSQVTAVPQVSNLSLSKVINNLAPNVGDTVTFTISVNNSGPNTATNVNVEDAIPNGYSNFINISNLGSVANDTINWNIASILSGNTQVLTYQATVLAPNIGVSFTNIAQITDADQFDPNSTPDNDLQSEDDYDFVTPVPQVSNLSLSKVINNPAPNVGDTVTFTISVNNSGPNTATNVNVEDAIPNGYGNISNISNSGILSNDTLTWSLASLLSGNNQIFTYQATVLPPLVGINYTNVAQVNATDQFDPNSTPDNDNPAEDDQSQVTIIMDNSVPIVNAGTDFTKTCVLNTSGLSIGETAEPGHSYSWNPALGLSSSTASNPLANPLITTTYTVTKRNLTNGFTAIDTIIVTVETTAPVVSINGTDTISVIKNSVLRIASGGISYLWSNAIGTNDTVSISSPGVYTVTATGLNGCSATATSEVIEVRFGSINGLAWIDNDNDGVQEISEAHTANETVYLYNSMGNILLDSTITDLNGIYSFDSLNSGTYMVRFKIPKAAMVSPSNMALDSLDSDFNLSAWSESISIDVSKPVLDTLRNRKYFDIGFANFGSISGKVFDDKDFNNTQSGGDLNLVNIEIYLVDDFNVKIDSTISNVSGAYAFDSLVGGNYKIQFVKPIGMNASLKDIGSDDTKDSDPDNISGLTDNIFINSSLPINDPARNFTSIDAGFVNYDSKINLTKDGELVGNGLVGDFITYGFTVKNTGNTTLRNVFIIDSLISVNPIAVSPDSLTPGQTGFVNAQYYLNANDVSRGKVMNSAMVYGTDPLDSVVTDISDNVNPYQAGPSDSTEVNLPKVDISLAVEAVSNCLRQINDTIVYRIIVRRTDTLNVIDNISIKDSLGTHLEFVSASATSGTYNPTSHIWSNVDLSNNDNDTLTIMAKVLTNIGGLIPLTAWIYSSNFNDMDSTPRNKIIGEDDYGQSWVVVPISICSTKNEIATLTAPTGYSTYQWQLNGSDLVGGTGSTYATNLPGNYTVILNGVPCSTGNCCPIVVLDNCECKTEICIPLKITKTK